MKLFWQTIAYKRLQRKYDRAKNTINSLQYDLKKHDDWAKSRCLDTAKKNKELEEKLLRSEKEIRQDIEDDVREDHERELQWQRDTCEDLRQDIEVKDLMIEKLQNQINIKNDYIKNELTTSNQ